MQHMEEEEEEEEEEEAEENNFSREHFLGIVKVVFTGWQSADGVDYIRPDRPPHERGEQGGAV